MGWWGCRGLSMWLEGKDLDRMVQTHPEHSNQQRFPGETETLDPRVWFLRIVLQHDDSAHMEAP